MTITSNRSDHVEFGRRQCVVRVGNVSARASLRAITVVASLLAGTLVIAVSQSVSVSTPSHWATCSAC